MFKKPKHPLIIRIVYKQSYFSRIDATILEIWKLEHTVYAYYNITIR